jgi:hypothetical protein
MKEIEGDADYCGMLVGFPEMTFDEANEQAHVTISKIKELEHELWVFCNPVVKVLVARGWPIDNVMDVYYDNVGKCAAKHDVNKINFCSFLRTKMNNELLSMYRTGKMHEDIIDRIGSRYESNMYSEQYDTDWLTEMKELINIYKSRGLTDVQTTLFDEENESDSEIEEVLKQIEEY